MLKRFWIVLVLLGIFTASASGQRRLQNMPRYDQKTVHFGFSVGLNYMDFKIDPIRNLSGLTNFKNVRSITEPGYTIAIISNLRLAKYADLRFNPGFATTSRTLEFDLIDPNSEERIQVDRTIESAFIEFPLELKFKSQRVDNYRLYVLGGLKYALDLSSDEKSEDDRVFKIKQDDYSYELGAGIDIYFEYFKFSPQIKATFGMTNLRVEDGTQMVSGIEALQTRAILINFTFE